MPRHTSEGLVALTGVYAAIGATQIVQDLARGRGR
jgi:hypothetical protein